MRLSLLNKVEDAHDDAVWSCAWATPNLLITGVPHAILRDRLAFLIIAFCCSIWLLHSWMK